MADHDNDSNGICINCGAGSVAYTLDSNNSVKTYYKAIEDALNAAYKAPNDLSVWITNYDQAITLANSCSVHVCEGVTIQQISTSTAASNATFNIYNDGGTIEKISPADSGTQTLKITNQGIISEIIIPNNKSLSTEITNNGTIKRLVANKLIKLLSGTGVYNSIYTGGTGLALGGLLGNGCKFYLIYETEGEKWQGPDYTLQGTSYFIVSTPPFSVTVDGPDELQPDGRGGYSLTLADGVVQDKKLTAELSFPDSKEPGLSSEGAGLTYKWYYAGVEEAKWTEAELPLNELAVGTHHLTLQVTDDRYNYTYSTNVTVTITTTGKASVSLKKPEGSFTKMYDGTTDVPKNLTIGFVDPKGRTVPLEKGTDYTVEAAYNSADCKDAEKITVKVELIGDAANTYSLPTNTLTVDGTIAKFKPAQNQYYFKMAPQSTSVKVGDRILTENLSFTVDGAWSDNSLLDPLGAKPTITYYRMRTKGVYDPTTDEKITEDSTFTYAGEYLIYAVIGETDNYAELFAQYTTITAGSTSGKHSHCLYGHQDCTVDYLLTYADFKGSSLSLDGSEDQRSYYLNAAKANADLTLILRQFSDGSGETPSLDLCLYGKTLRADSNYFSQFRVTNKWRLSLTDCIGTGVLKGTSVDDAHGGCLYVADAIVDISNIKITGGSSSQSGGAIVVDEKGVLNIYSGEISGNHVTGGNGGAIYIKSGGVVNMYGGTIQNNHAYSGNGGAIYVAEGGTLNLFGGTIIGNTASGLGGGIYVEAGGKVTVQGNPVVTGNTAGGKTSNLYVDGTGPLLTIDAEGLTEGAQIGISTDASYPVLLAGSKQDHSAYFIPDDLSTFVFYNSSANLLTLCAKPTATLADGTLTITTGSGYQFDTFVLIAAEYDADGKMLAVHTWAIEPQNDTYDCDVDPSARIKCFLLRKDSYTPVLAPFSPRV